MPYMDPRDPDAKRYLGECPECRAQFQTADPSKCGITTTPCPSCETALCSECPTRVCEECGEKVCQACAEPCPIYSAEGYICKACFKRNAGTIDGYSPDEYAERQTNILSGIERESAILSIVQPFAWACTRTSDLMANPLAVAIRESKS